MNKKFLIPPELTIPYYDEDRAGGFFAALRKSAKRRNMNPVRFAFRKLFNTFLYWIGYFCPLMSIRVFSNKLRGVKMGKNVTIQQQCMIDNAYPEYVILEDNVSINQNSTIIAHTNPSKRWKGVLAPHVKPVILKKGCLIGLNSIILPGVTIGEQAIVSAGSVVTKNVADYSVVRGNPARNVTNIKKLLNNPQ